MDKSQLLSMRAEIIADQKALPSLLHRREDKQLLTDLNRYMEAELGLVELALEFQKPEIESGISNAPQNIGR